MKKYIEMDSKVVASVDIVNISNGIDILVIHASSIGSYGGLFTRINSFKNKSFEVKLNTIGRIEEFVSTVEGLSVTDIQLADFFSTTIVNGNLWRREKCLLDFLVKEGYFEYTDETKMFRKTKDFSLISFNPNIINPIDELKHQFALSLFLLSEDFRMASAEAWDNLPADTKRSMKMFNSNKLKEWVAHVISSKGSSVFISRNEREKILNAFNRYAKKYLNQFSFDYPFTFLDESAKVYQFKKVDN